jgi:hypothetical protein
MEGVKMNRGYNEVEPKFWHARVWITQIPSDLEEQVILSAGLEKPEAIEKSWLHDPFLDRTIYGLELSLNQNFRWAFFLKENSEAEATRKGHSYLMALEERFPGLVGTVEIVPITPTQLQQKSFLYEIVLPKSPYNRLEKWEIIKKIIQLFRNNEHNNFQFYIFWQRDDSVNIRKATETSIYELYKVKIFFRVIHSPRKKGTDKLETSKLYGQLDYLVVGIRNLKGERAFIRNTRLNKWENILAMDVFWENSDDIHTHFHYHDIAHEIPPEKFPAFINPARVDFRFREELPLLQARILPFENINYSSTHVEHEEIAIGTIVNKGVPSKNIKYLPIQHFAHSVFIAGKPGAGKTYFLGQILKEFYEKTKEIGVLIINLGKAKQEGYYKTDRVLRYGDPEFHLSYFYEGDYLDRSLQETASYLVAALGLGSPCDKIMYSVMKSFLELHGELPHSLDELFVGLRRWFKAHPYDDKYQTRIVRALKNRIPTLLSDPILDNMLELRSPLEIPAWFQEWKQGKTIFIDLCMCTTYIKQLITSAILQMVRTLTPDREAGKLESIIVIDEAHQILEESISRNPNSDEFISKEQLKLIFNHLMREFRSKGLSFILVDNVPNRLFSCATTLPSLKILFILDHLDMDVFTKNPYIQEYLILQSPRHALVMNGNNEEIFVIRTLDYQYSIP